MAKNYYLTDLEPDDVFSFFNEPEKPLIYHSYYEYADRHLYKDGDDICSYDGNCPVGLRARSNEYAFADEVVIKPMQIMDDIGDIRFGWVVVDFIGGVTINDKPVVVKPSARSRKELLKDLTNRQF